MSRTKAITGKPLELLGVATTASRLAQLEERRSAEQEVVSASPGGTNTQGLKMTGEKVLSL